MKNKRLILIIFTTIILLFISLIAMQFTNEVNWKVSDFVVAGALLIGTGLMCELVIRKVKVTKYRIAICFAFLTVGIFGTPFGGQ